MSTLTLRLTKGSALTYQEADDNFTNLNNDKLQNVVEDTTPQLGGNLDVNTRSIVSTSNGNITLAPNGTGKVVISGDLQVDGTTTTINSTTLDVDDINITVAKGAVNAAAANGAGLTVEGPTTAATLLYASADDSWNLNKKTAAIELQIDNINVNGNTISSTNTNGTITLTPNGTGDLVLDGLKWPQADGTANYVLKTDGAGQLSWVAQSGGSFTSFTVAGDTGTSQTINDANTLTISGGTNLNSVASATDTITINLDSSVSGLTSVGSTAFSGTNFDASGSSGGHLRNSSGVDQLDWGAGGSSNLSLLVATNINPANANVSIAPTGTGSLTINPATAGTMNNVAIGGTTAAAGTFTAVNTTTITGTGTNANITITPDGTGSIVLDGLNWPTADGSANQVLKTNGTGQLSFVTISSGITDVVNDTTPQLGGDLDVNGFDITDTGATALLITSNTDKNLGLRSQGTGDVILLPLGSGKVTIDGLNWPTADGTNNQVLTTNGTGQLSFTTISGSGITDVVQDTTPQLGGNLDVQSFSITSSVGAITLSPSGNNDVILDTEGLAIGDGTGVPSIYSNNATYEGIVLKTHSTYLGAVTLNGGNNGDIKVTPHGTGKILLESNNLVIGDVNADVTLTTSGTGDLILSTGNDTNTGKITIFDGVNGNITLTPNGTGNLVLDGLNWPQADGTANYVLKTNGSGQLSWVAQGAAVGDITGLGTGVATALAVNVGTDGAFVVRGGALGTPSGGILTNATGLPVSTGISGLGTGVATFLATPSSANLISAVTDETGTGTLVFSASPTFTGTVNAAALTLTGAATLKDIRETVYAIGNSGTSTLTPDAANGSVQTITATGNFTLSAFSNPVSGQTITFIITQDGTGSRTLTSTMKFAGGSKTLTTTASAIDIMTVSYIGTTYYASLSKAFA